MKRTLLIALFTALVSGVGYGQQFPPCPLGFTCKVDGDTMTLTRSASLATSSTLVDVYKTPLIGRKCWPISSNSQGLDSSWICGPSEIKAQAKGVRDRKKRAHAQQSQKPDPQAEFKAAQKRLSDAETARDAALSAFAVALADRNAVLYKMMAESGIKPSQCAAEGNPFACVRADPKTGDISFTPKPAEQPKEKQ